MDRAKLKSSIQIKYGTAEPTNSEMDRLVEQVKEIVRRNHRGLTESEWKEIVTRSIPSTGTQKYAARDDSDLNALITDIVDQAGGKKP